MFTYPDGVALPVTGCGTGLSIDKTGSSGAGSIELKGLCECGGIFPVAFHSLPSASSSK